MTRILIGSAIERLRALPDESVHCVISSPPYWGLRSYELTQWVGGDPDCDHKHETKHQQQGSTSMRQGRANVDAQRNENHRGACSKCGARKVAVKGGIGLEDTFEEHVENLVAVFREVRRVLRADGICWLNYGDAFAAARSYQVPDSKHRDVGNSRGATVPDGLKAKDLMMMGPRVALALQADGWWVRQRIVWHKPNPMPESVTDRPTSAFEDIYLLSKSGSPTFWTHPTRPGRRTEPEPDYVWINRDTGDQTDTEPAFWRTATSITAEPDEDGKRPLLWKRRNLWNGHDYFYDGDAVRTGGDWDRKTPHRKRPAEHDEGRVDSKGNAGILDGPQSGSGANLRNVWTIPTSPFPGAHFAVFPPALVEPMVKAGTSEKGVCPTCGAPWARVTKKTATGRIRSRATGGLGQQHSREPHGLNKIGGTFQEGIVRTTTGWRPTCDHGKFDAAKGSAATNEQGIPRHRAGGGFRPGAVGTEWTKTCDHADAPVPAVILDPFGGAGTVGLVAQRLQRAAILIEISSKYARMAASRIEDDAPLFADVRVEA